MASNLRGSILVLVALSVGACGGSTQPASIAPASSTLSPSSTTTVESPTPTEAQSESSASGPGSEGTTTTAPALAFTSNGVPPGPICDWLQSASFSSDEAWVSFDAGEGVELAIEDWVERIDVMCVADALIVEPGSYDYHLMLRVEAGVLLLESLSGEWQNPLPATDIVTRDQAMTQGPVSAEWQGALDVGLQAIESYLNGDASGFEVLLADELLSVDNREPIHRDDVMDFALSNGFPFGEAYSGYDMSDYLINYAPVILPIDQLGEETAGAFERLVPGAMVVWFVGFETKPDGSAFLWDDLLGLVIANNGSGWQIVGL